MDGETVRVLLLALLGAGGGLWLASSLLVRVGGTWERELSRDERARGERADRFSLSSVGPWVSGRVDIDGGHQELSGLIVGRTLHLTRRDHGVRALVVQGYPEAIAKNRDGKDAARYKLKLDGDRLVGEFIGRKIEFTHQPPRVTAVLDLAPQPRVYKRVVEVYDEEPIVVEAAEPSELA